MAFFLQLYSKSSVYLQNFLLKDVYYETTENQFIGYIVNTIVQRFLSVGLPKFDFRERRYKQNPHINRSAGRKIR